MERMLQLPDAWPPAGIQIVRRYNPAGRVELPAIADHRVSLHLSVRTSTACRESGQRFVRRRGDIDLTPAHSVGGFDADEGSVSLEARIPDGFLQRVAGAMHSRSMRAEMEVRHLLREERLTHLLLALDAEHRAGAPGGRLYLDSVGVALAAQLLAVQVPSPRLPSEGLASLHIQRVIDFIETNLEGTLSLTRLASVAGVSQSHLQREFKSTRGMSVHRYVVERRVERARALLMQRSLPASEIALAAGFAHQSHMARWIRRVLGMTPSELLGH
jgi:AraC family transcriptional regulator